MDPAALLTMPPELLAKAVLHRREQLVESLPDQIASLREQIEGTTPLTSDTGQKRDDVNSKVALLKEERNSNKAQAFELIRKTKELREKLLSEGRLRNPDPKWAKDKLIEDIARMEEEFQTRAGDHKAEQKFLRQVKEMNAAHQAQVKARMDSNPELSELDEMQARINPLFEAAEKAHEAMMELVGESGELHDSWSSMIEEQRILNSRLHRAESTLESSQKACEMWQRRLKDGFADLGPGLPDLMAAAKRVEEGGLSSIAIRRNAKRKREAEEKSTKGGEEE